MTSLHAVPAAHQPVSGDVVCTLIDYASLKSGASLDSVTRVNEVCGGAPPILCRSY